VAQVAGTLSLPGGAAGASADQELVRNMQLARAIGASGTPTFVVGDQVLQGAVGYETLKKAIEETRSKRA
jgi:protein-disulfide isomerase